MAAGKGTRLRTRRPKALHEVGGKALLSHVLDTASALVEGDDIYVVIGHEADRVRNAVGGTGVQFVEQKEQRGTGHAIQCARDLIAKYGHILVLSGDVPLISATTLQHLMTMHLAEGAAMSILTAAPQNPTGYGRVIRRSPDRSEVDAIVEQKALKPDQLGVKEINSGIYAFRTEPLLAHISRLSSDNPHGELYLTDMAAHLNAAGEKVVALPVSDPEEVQGGNTIAELVAMDSRMRVATANRLMAAGVTIFRPETCVI